MLPQLALHCRVCSSAVGRLLSFSLPVASPDRKMSYSTSSHLSWNPLPSLSRPFLYVAWEQQNECSQPSVVLLRASVQGRSVDWPHMRGSKHDLISY